MILINNKKKKLFRIKLKDSTGSAMSLVIVVMALLLIFAPYMTNQIANQFRSTKNSYEDIQVKYLAEAGIERSIAEIEKQVKLNATKTDVVEYSNTNHHPNDICPKVNYQENGLPEWGKSHDDVGNTFYKLIRFQMIENKIADKYQTLLNPHWTGYFHPGIDLWSYYQNKIRSVTDTIVTMDKKDTVNLKNKMNELESNLNYFISKLKEAIEIVKKYQGYEWADRNEVIKSYNEMIGYMEEIKCRLGMGSTGGGEEIIENKEIEVPYYDVTIDDNDNLTFNKNSTKTKRCQITIKKQNGKTTSIDFTNINNNLIGAKANNYEISADIDFAYLNKFNTIEQSVNSYNRVN